MNGVALPMARGTQGRPGITLAACALVVVVALAALGQLSAGFEHWTFEAQRRHDAASGRMAFPGMDLVASSGQARLLPAGGTGQVMLVAFIYTNCPSVCQSLGAELYQAQQRIQSEGSGIGLLSVSIDPLRDTPVALAGYARLHRADARTWTIAAPASVGDGQRARRALRVISVDDGSGGFVHNGALHVVDRNGRVAGIFDTADWQRALALAEALERAGP